jgi:hypothetical protein
LIIVDFPIETLLASRRTMIAGDLRLIRAQKRSAAWAIPF